LKSNTHQNISLICNISSLIIKILIKIFETFRERDLRVSLFFAGGGGLTPPPLGAGFVPEPPWVRVIFVPLVMFPVMVFSSRI
jgi:hypothetical protein